MDGTARNHPVNPTYRSLWSRTLLSGIAGASGLLALPAVAQAASTTTSVCNNVSAAAVSSIIGYVVPPGTLYTLHLKATPANFQTSAVETTCTYGAQTSIAALTKDVTLSFEVLSKPLTASEIQQSLAKLSTLSLKIKITAYSGLGVPGWYFTETSTSKVPGVPNAEGLSGSIAGGAQEFGVSVETQSLPLAKLAALAKLAEKL
jgi:hypothetical protein